MMPLEQEPLILPAYQIRSRSAFRAACAAHWGPDARLKPGQVWVAHHNHGRGVYALPCERVRLECLRRVEDGAAAVTIRLVVDSPFHSVYQIGRSRVDVDAWRAVSTVSSELGTGLMLSGTFPAAGFEPAG